MFFCDYIPSIRAYALAAVALTQGGCDGCGQTEVTQLPSNARAFASAQPVNRCPRFDQGRQLATVADPKLDELSGLAVSQKNPGILWTHNDSGHKNDIYALRFDGSLAATFSLSGGESIDWEDVAIGAGPEAGVDYLYVADLGSNKVPRDLFVIYRVPEPNLESARGSGPADPDAGDEVTVLTENVALLYFRYPNGEVYDAETIMIDGPTGDLVVVTKSFAGKSVVFRAHPPDAASTPETLKRVIEINIEVDERRGNAQVTGGDISRDGRQVLIRTYTDIFWWARTPGASLESALAKERCTVSVHEEPQGESVAFSPDGKRYYTVSEGKNQPIYRFVRAD